MWWLGRVFLKLVQPQVTACVVFVSGKTYTMIGVDDSSQNLGVIPSAISWLFRLIDKHKERTGARFSVRVSAIEITGKDEKLKDLLADVAKGNGSFFFNVFCANLGLTKKIKPLDSTKHTLLNGFRQS